MAEKIVWSVKKIVASIDVVLGADKSVGASANEIDATNKNADASIEEVDATNVRVGAAETNEPWSNESAQRRELLFTRRTKSITRRAYVNSQGRK